MQALGESMETNRIQILIDLKHAASPAIKKLVNDQSLSYQGVVLRSLEIDDRSVDSNIFIAIASAAGGALTALIAGLLGVASQSKSRSVIIKGRSGRSIEVPSDIPTERIREYVRIAREIDIDRIELSD